MEDIDHPFKNFGSIWDTDNGRLVTRYVLPAVTLHSPSGRVKDAGRPAELSPLAALSSHGNWIAILNESVHEKNGVTILDKHTGEVVYQFALGAHDGDERYYCVAFGPDGLSLFAASTHSLEIGIFELSVDPLSDSRRQEVHKKIDVIFGMRLDGARVR
jgi:WD40 repeat protein